jgi:ABC-type transport system involved in multi-copper enzyme maturation permease subunit
MILPLVFAGILIAGLSFDDILAGVIPDWYYGLQLINPLSAYSGLVSVNVKAVGNMAVEGVDISYPSFYTSWLMILILAIWIIVSIFLAFWRFNEKDI